MIREELVMVCCCDIAGQVRGKGFPLRDLPGRLGKGIGWTPTNIQITAFGPIADTPWGPFGDLFLVPDPATETRVDFEDGSPVEHFLLGDIRHTDGRPWDCCPRTFLRNAHHALEREFGLTLRAAFEHEFFDAGADERTGSSYTLDAIRRQGDFPEVFLAALTRVGLECDSYLGEYGPRQYEVTYAPGSGVACGDQAVILREVARATARRLGHRISFAPAVTPDVVGNGVHIHMSFADGAGQPVTHDPERPHGLSERAASFAAGVLRHAPALCAFTAPSVVSYLRLVPHRWSAAWNNLGFRDREALVRIAPVDERPGGNIAAQYNIEYRAADATASPYLALGAILSAGLEGLRRSLPAPDVTEVDPGTLGEAERATKGLHRLPQSLGEALDALEADEVARSWLPAPFLDVYLRHKRTEIAIMEDLDRDERCRRYADAY
jgi:glutamine synthetase